VSLGNEQPGRRDPDDLAPEPLPRPVDDPGGVDFADLFDQGELVGVAGEVLEVGEPRLVAAREELFGDDRLRLDVDDLLPVRRVDVAGGRRDQAEGARALDLAATQDREGLGRVDEGVDDEDLRPVALGHLVHERVGAALDQVGVVPATDQLEAVEEVADVGELEVLDALELQVGDRGPLVARARRSQGHHRDLARVFSCWPHPVDQD